MLNEAPGAEARGGGALPSVTGASAAGGAYPWAVRRARGGCPSASAVAAPRRFASSWRTLSWAASVASSISSALNGAGAFVRCFFCAGTAPRAPRRARGRYGSGSRGDAARGHWRVGTILTARATSGWVCRGMAPRRWG